MLRTLLDGPPVDSQTDPAPRPWTAAALIAVAVLIAGGAFVVQFAPGPTVSRPAIRRIVTPKPLPAAIEANCPQLNNPGGGLDWTPISDPGPVPTNGTVVLPSLRVAAPIVRVGIDTQRLMVVPKNATDVGWLDQGGFPGRTKNVVLAGHIAYSRVAGSFNRLDELRPGDDVYVAIGGRHWRYRVTWNCQFPRDTKLVDHIMGYTEVPSVTLISCGGVFDTAARTHTKRIAVRAELVSSA